MNSYYLGALVISFLSAVVLVPIIRTAALKIGFMDIPSSRKVHVNPIPLGGGVAVFFALVLASIFMALTVGFGDAKPLLGIMAGAFLIVLIGAYDDYFDMDVQLKLIGQIIAAILFINFVDYVSPVLSFAAYPILAVFWITSLQNAFNFLDNMDGLCGGISLIISAGMGILFVFKGMPVYAAFSFALAGAAIGFLRYNLPPAKIFLGDTGSLLFGFCLSCLSIVHLNTSENLVDALAPVLIILYPVFDLTFVIVTRLNEGRKVYIGGKDHSSHKISFMGVSRRTTVFIIYLINFMLALSGVALYFWIESPYKALIVVLFAVILAFTGVHIYKNILYIKHKVFAILLDLSAINLAFLVYYYFKYSSGALQYYSMIPLDELMVPLVWINIYWLSLFAMMGLYDIPFEMKYKFHIITLLKSLAAGLLLFLIINFNASEGFVVSLVSVMVYIGSLFVISLLFRLLLYSYFKSIVASETKRAGAVIVSLESHNSNSENLLKLKDKYNIIGYVGVDNGYDCEKLGEPDELYEVLKANRVARVIIDISKNDFRKLDHVFSAAYFLETEFVTTVAGYDNIRGMKKYETRFSNMYFISIRYQKFFTRVAKRFVEAFLALGILLISSPILAAKFIKLKLIHQPLLKKIEFSGVHGKTHSLLCYGDTVCDSGAPGVYSVGLPALVSVIRGSLALAGTLIISTEKAEEDSRLIKGYWRRDLVKPGMFGFAQARDVERYFENEMTYLEKLSFWSDMLYISRGLIALIFKPTRNRNA